jgi:hypothetical protein
MGLRSLLQSYLYLIFNSNSSSVTATKPKGKLRVHAAAILMPYILKNKLLTIVAYFKQFLNHTQMEGSLLRAPSVTLTS